jgi:methyltransferase (TIGR00027 family)
MTHANDDGWDLKTGVGATATMVAAARAVVSKQSDPLIDDPFAEILVRAVGLKIFTRIVDGLVDFSEIGAGWMPPLFGIRSRTVDDFVADACRAGIRQGVILASGLDCRAYRLDWPAAMSLYEVDQPAVIDWKRGILAMLGCTSTAQHSYVGADLRQDWPAALQQAGFDAAKPTVWIIEGLLIGYLPPTAHDEIFDRVTALSAPGSRIAADHLNIWAPDAVGEVLNKLHEVWCKLDPSLNLHNLTFSGEHRDPVAYLAERGWTAHSAELTELFRAIGRIAPATTGFREAAECERFLTGVRN